MCKFLFIIWSSLLIALSWWRPEQRRANKERATGAWRVSRARASRGRGKKGANGPRRLQRDGPERRAEHNGQVRWRAGGGGRNRDRWVQVHKQEPLNSPFELRADLNVMFACMCMHVVCSRGFVLCNVIRLLCNFISYAFSFLFFSFTLATCAVVVFQGLSSELKLLMNFAINGKREQIVRLLFFFLLILPFAFPSL